MDRTEETRPFEIDNLDLSDQERAQAPETIFDGAYAASSRMLLLLNSNGGYYTANDHLGAGYVQLEFALGERTRVITGLRAENSRVELHTQDAQGTKTDPVHEYLDFLPAAALTYRLTPSQNLRLSASQTLSRPEYREISPIRYAQNGFEGLIIAGDTSLQRVLIQNYDVRWEWYPTSAEVVSLGVFAKTFDQPIEKVIVGIDGDVLAAVRQRGRRLRTTVSSWKSARTCVRSRHALTPITLFANTTLMHSQIRPGNEGISSNTSSERPMQGQAPYVVNLGMSYASSGGRISATAPVQRRGAAGRRGRATAGAGRVRPAPARRRFLIAGARHAAAGDATRRQEPARLAVSNGPGIRHAAALYDGPSGQPGRHLDAVMSFTPTERIES